MARGFKWDPAGYKAIKNSSGVQNMLSNKAQAIANAANATVKNKGYQVDEVTGRVAGDRLRIVHCGDAESMYSNAKHNTLLKALGAAK